MDSSWFRVDDRPIELIVIIGVIKIKQHSMEKQRRLRVTLDWGEGEFGRARAAEASFKEEVIFDQGLKGRVEFSYRIRRKGQPSQKMETCG